MVISTSLSANVTVEDALLEIEPCVLASLVACIVDEVPPIFRSGLLLRGDVDKERNMAKCGVELDFSETAAAVLLQRCVQ